MQIFISHAEQDNELASKLASRLSAAGLDVWNAAEEIEPGDNWAMKVGQALEDSDLMLILATPEGLQSEPVKYEIDYALSTKKFQHRLMSVAVGSDSDLPWILRKQPIIRLDSVDADIETAVQQIVDLAQRNPNAAR